MATLTWFFDGLNPRNRLRLDFNTASDKIDFNVQAGGKAAIRAEALVVVQVQAGAGADVRTAHGLLRRNAEAVHHALGIGDGRERECGGPQQQAGLEAGHENIPRV